MSKGIRIPSKNTYRFTEICKALDAACIPYEIWNAEAMLDPNYDGPIDLNCNNMDLWDDFVDIITPFM